MGIAPSAPSFGPLSFVLRPAQRTIAQSAAPASTAAATHRHHARGGAAGASRHDRQTARRLVNRITISTQSPQQSAPQSAHTPAAGAWQYAQ